VIDQALRAQLAPSLDRVADRLAARDVPALGLTAAALLAGLGACVAIAESAWALALVLWLANRCLRPISSTTSRCSRSYR